MERLAREATTIRRRVLQLTLSQSGESLSHPPDFILSWTLRPSIYANRGDETTDGYDDASFAGQIGAGALHEEAETTIWGTALQAARQGDGGGLLTVALDLRRESWQASGFQIVAAGGGGGGGGGGGMGGGDRTSTVDIEEDREVEQSSLALEYELAPGGRWTAVIGAGWAAQRRDEIGRDEDYSFLVGGSYELGRDLKLRGSVARRVRFPTLRDLYAADRGNPTLEPERTVDGELALERSLGLGQNLELTVFRIEADDFIERVPNDVLRNIQESRFQGVELAGRHRLDGSVRLSWSYGYLDSRNLSADGGTDKTQNRPEHKATLVGEGVTAKGWRLRGEALFVADSYALSRQRPARAMELGDYLVVGASLAVPLRGEDWRVVGRVTNLFDTAYVESIGFPAPGREFLVAFEVGRSPASRP